MTQDATPPPTTTDPQAIPGHPAEGPALGLPTAPYPFPAPLTDISQHEHRLRPAATHTDTPPTIRRRKGKKP